MDKIKKNKIVFEKDMKTLQDYKNISQDKNIINMSKENFLSDKKTKNESLYATSPFFVSTSNLLFDPATDQDNFSLPQYKEEMLDLYQHLMINPKNTFFVQIHNDSMIDIGICPGNLLIVDRSLRPCNGKIIIAILKGELIVKRLFKEEGKIFLMSENTSYPTLEITQEVDFMIWGVVTNVIQTL